ncbi:pilus assembly protein [Tessaracoccus sp. OS52]|uniref:TadE/TadG family type IV pilus assembly protein n=1 Tax=Tessaracoccus sp. OS52 TaxID=2886691 RepID=UPI001D105A01|nr:TadE/TadG family type IV pilus assembly protein [Tessaracoccus sp. OS52]MCC2592479.1 pilus assembly protein [Tessaracoccus sp. OS52]
MSSSVQLTLLFPLVFAAFLATLQWAMITWADATALAAAQDGARLAAARHSTAAAGQAAAAAAANNGSLTAVTTTINRGPTQTAATVTGTALSIIPGYTPTITKSAQAPTERLTQS